MVRKAKRIYCALGDLESIYKCLRSGWHTLGSQAKVEFQESCKAVGTRKENWLVWVLHDWPATTDLVKCQICFTKMFIILFLGQFLSLLYIDDIKSVIQNAYCHLYADDTIILKGASDPDKTV